MERILLVDDERILKTALAAALRQDGYEVLLADSGEQALGAAEATPVDLLLTDVRMPGMDGLELLRTLRGRQPGLAAIVMTAYGSVETAVEAMRLGASDFLTKPFKVAELRAAVARVLAGPVASSGCPLAGSRYPRAAPRAASPFRLAEIPHEFLAAPGAVQRSGEGRGWLYDLWHAGPGRRGILFAATPAAGPDVLRALVRAESAHHRKPQSVVASVERWLESELSAFVGVVDLAGRILQFAARGGVRARLCGSSFGADELTGGHDDEGVAIEGSDRLLVASEAAAADEPQAPLEWATRLSAGAALRVNVGALARGLEEETLTLRFPCAAEDYVERTEAVAARAGFDKEETFRVVASVAEAVDNARRHAYAAQGDGVIEVRYLVTPGELVIHVRDAGSGFDASAAEPALVGADDLFRESGRGFLLMHHLMDAVEVESASGRGTTVRMEKGRSRGDNA